MFLIAGVVLHGYFYFDIIFLCLDIDGSVDQRCTAFIEKTDKFPETTF